MTAPPVAGTVLPLPSSGSPAALVALVPWTTTSSKPASETRPLATPSTPTGAAAPPMDVVHSLAWTHPGGTLVFAEAQTEGRGRHQRKWVDVSGCSIAVSILLRDRLWDGIGDGIPLLAGLAVLEAIEETQPGLDGLALDWPNDVVHAPSGAHPRKAAGLLLEAGRDPQGSPYAVLGIGINVNHTPDQLPPTPESRVPPTSLRMAAGGRIQPTPPVRVPVPQVVLSSPQGTSRGSSGAKLGTAPAHAGPPDQRQGTGHIGPSR